MIWYVLTIIVTYAILGTIQAINALPRKNKPETFLDKVLIPGVFIILPIVWFMRSCIEFYNYIKKVLKNESL